MRVLVGPDAIVMAARATAVALAAWSPRPRLVMVLGGPGLARELRDAGLRVVGPTQRAAERCPEALVVGADFALTYRRLTAAVSVVAAGAAFVATNRDPLFPLTDGFTPGAGAIVAAIAYATGREPDLVVGKPEPRLFLAAAELAGMPVEASVVVGDSLMTDIAAARAVGARSVLMLTGVTRPEEVDLLEPSARPTAVARDAAELEAHLEHLAADLPNHGARRAAT